MRLRVTCFDDVGFCFCVVSFLKLPSPWRNIYLYLYICIALIRLLFDKCILFVYLKSNGMFPLERFLNLFKYVPLEKPEIFDARDILSQVLVFDLVGFFLFPPPSPCSTVVVIWFACWTSGPCFPMGLCGWGFAYLTRLGLVSLLFENLSPLGWFSVIVRPLGSFLSPRCPLFGFDRFCTNQNKKCVYE